MSNIQTIKRFLSSVDLKNYKNGAILTVCADSKVMGYKFIVSTTKDGRKWLKTHCKRSVELIRENPEHNYKIK